VDGRAHRPQDRRIPAGTKSGATATYRFRGYSIALIGDHASNRGSLLISFDGKAPVTVNTSGATANRLVVFQKRFAAGGTHTIKMVAASAARVDLDALLVSG
jgi:hypothetical protein